MARVVGLDSRCSALVTPVSARFQVRVGCAPTYIDEPVVGDLPAALQPQHAHRGRLLGREVGEGRVGDVVGLQVELVERGEQLGDGADALVRHVDAVCDREGDEAGVEGGPEPLLGHLAKETS